MNNYLAYIIESGIVFSFLYLLYLLLFANTTFFNLNRLYLVTIVILSVIVPFINFNLTPENVLTRYAYEFDPVSITQTKITNSTPKLFIRILIYIYISGTVLFGLRFLFQLLKIFFIAKRAKTIKNDLVKIVVTDKNCSPFSFFNIIFLPREKEEDEVLVHELIHCRQGHSFDTIAMEAFTILQWFNPFVWLYRSSLKTVHEFLADEGVLLKGFNKPAYQHLLLEKAFDVRLSSLAANFNYSLLKKRIKMMTKNKSDKRSLLKYSLIVPFFMGMILYFGCTGKDEIKDAADKVIAAENEITPKNEITDENNQSATQEEVSQDKQIFVVVEEMPQFQGEQAEAFRKYLMLNVKYPELAKKNGISGKVFVQFVVDQQGKVTDAKILRGVHPLLDEEALRVVKSSPDWTPGKQRGQIVNVQFTVPITFGMK